MGSMTLPPHWLGTLPLLPNARCQHVNDPDVFFSADIDVMTYAARRICQGCPEQTACLMFALDQDITIGVWGGLLPDERARVTAHLRRDPSLPATAPVTAPERSSVTL
jgi:WhiB family transcriptional regulator, redox-sensing transcriptional regulator